MRKSRTNNEGFWFKTGLFALLAGISFWVFQQFDNSPSATVVLEGQSNASHQRAECLVPEEMLPTSSIGAVVCHTYYAVSYSEEHEQAEWVAYELLRERLEKPWVERSGAFRPCPDVSTESATPRDYTGSGYDRGHLVPAADMAFDPVAMDKTFLMCNISPQVRAFNGGIWRELEENMRDWARRVGQLYVVTGPVLSMPPVERIGFNRVSVPQAYYKIALAPRQQSGIAFVIPNALSERPLMDYACTIDDVEALTNIDFFPKVLAGDNEAVEAYIDKNLWPVSRKRYEKRLRQWNRR